MRRIAYLTSLAVLLAGCQNFQSPKLHVPDRAGCKDSPSLCFLRILENEYLVYNKGAQNSRAASDGIVLGATGASVIGAATGANSDLYKATGGIALSALGISTYTNFKTQSLATRVALTKLICAEGPLTSLLKLSGEIKGESGGYDFSKNRGSLLAKFDLTGSTVKVNDFETKIDTTDVDAIGRLISVYAAATDNVTKAVRIQQQIEFAAMHSLAKLQDSVITQIETDSFKIDEAVRVIKPSSPSPSSPPAGSQKVFEAADKIIVDDEAARKIIADYNKLAVCLGGDFVPVDFD